MSGSREKNRKLASGKRGGPRSSLQSHLEKGTCSGGVRCHIWRGCGTKHLRREAPGRGGSLLLIPPAGQAPK